ncbi:pseudaminic acid cytidylyltransferase [Pseudomonas sp. RW10S2]|uniref:pseudaminic acid cytidylyltransferase n=1 Tax=Pseudomonas sp. RW10S2 TaxID=459637 RepID=UPI0016473792|nr:pseudaminic acid cytidylyltransferase [Pseudomonas sp. RW10S2]MBC3465573.1 pseudaminic acid cytidylyltransferase [Pseudomonas sp. RW10S2]QXI44666.1 pseudaminic acid cytidylyltransferase [Pseudomonas wayambapalatensis]
MKVAIIPARGGSKRIPHKNIKLFGGKPMIAWSIETALHSGCFDHVIVSTDDAQVAEVAQEYGAQVPFMRPAELADDYCGTVPVIQHAINAFLPDADAATALVCCLYATAPFVRAEDLRIGLSNVMQDEVDFSFSVARYPYPIQRALQLNAEGRLEMMYPDHFNTRSQDLPEVLHDAGQFYWGTVRAWLEGLPVFGSASVPVVLPSYRVQDIDTPEDWERAEWMMREMWRKTS